MPKKYVYKGEFSEGKRNGFGTMKLLNKDRLAIYEGLWVDGNKHGKGKQIDEYGILYDGEWRDGKKHGFGDIKLPEGDKFQGYFMKGMKNGEGRETFRNGDKYEGNYLNSKFHGEGKVNEYIGAYYWGNGSIYVGEFVEGMRCGRGRWFSSKSGICDEYEGEYENDHKNGYGIYRWADGTEYEGYFRDDLKDGEGVVRYKSGKIAKMLWSRGEAIRKL